MELKGPVMPEGWIESGVVLQGGPADGRVLPLPGDPLAPATFLTFCDEAGNHVYSPRPRMDADDGPLWVYTYMRTESAPQP